MSNENPSNVINLNHVAVPAAAVIGADIALCFALHGADAVLKDVSLDLATSVRKRMGIRS